MENSLANIIVKVGKQSKVKLSHCRALRAIVAEDLERLANKYTDCNIVIIESITNEENDTVRDFIKEFTGKSKSNSVLFFIADENDEVTSGLADELDFNIYFTLQDICKVIKNKYNINVSASLADRKDESYKEDDIPGLFDALGYEDNNTDNSDNAIENEIEQTEEVNQEEFNTIKENREQELERSSSYEEKETDSLFEMPVFDLENTETVKENTIEQTEDTEIKHTKTDKQEIKEEHRQSGVSNEELEKYKAQVKEEIEKLQTKLKDANYDYNILLKDVKGANTRILQLEEIIDVLKNEKQEIQARFDELLDDETVLEDPISLSEYSKLQETIDEKENNIQRLDQTVQSLKEQLDECKSDIELKNVEIGNLNGTIEELKASITSGEANKDQIEKSKEETERYKKSAEALRVEKDKLSDKLTSLGEINQELQNETEEAKHKLTLEVDYRKESIQLIQSAFTKVMEVNKSLEESTKKINKLQQELSKSNGIVEELRKQNDILNDDTVKLNETVHEKDEAIEKLENAMKNSDSFLDEKLNELSSVNKSKEELEQTLKSKQEQVATLKTQLDVVEAQLKQQEEQNRMLLSQQNTSTTSEETISTGEVHDTQLVELNKQLSQSNKALMEQLSVVKKELESQKQSHQTLQSEISKYKDQISKAGNAISTSHYESISPIQYSGRAQILSVCSSGSFGATTLAMSVMSRISPTAKVLYIDFDMVSPNADAWFSRSPFCQNLPNINRDVMSSGLGIFYEKGFDTFSSYCDKIIAHIERTKGGCIDYLSGLYYRVDRQKILSADYTGLFNLLGSQYEYIIVDLGRLGNSDINDMLIKVISDITYKNIVVTTPDRFEVRNFNMKLNNNGMNLQKIVWLLNMCTSTQIDQAVQKVVSSFRLGYIFEDSALRGTRDKFTRDRQNRDRLDAFINSALFSR